MTQRPFVFSLILFAGAAWAGDSDHALDVRPGTWESTVTVKTSGMPPIPAEVLARMTPEQKAMMESRMKSVGGKPTVSKRCITREDLAKGFNFDEARGTCKRTVVNSSSSKQEIRVECDNSGIKTAGTVKIEAMDAEHVKVSAHMTSGEGQRVMNVDVDGAGKWVSSDCAASK